MNILTAVTREDLPVKSFTFPDGQRHLELSVIYVERVMMIDARIASADELFDVLLGKDALDGRGCSTVLNIRYLMGARMDRRLSVDQPFTLQVVAKTLLAAGFRKIRILEPHSIVAARLLDAEAVYPNEVVGRALNMYNPLDTVLIAPDDGAKARVEAYARLGGFRVLQGHKHRDPFTGALSQFTIDEIGEARNKTCLIVDDICDGGRTFTGVAEVLSAAGAAAVDLYVTHGIFSAGTPLAGIRKIYTTDSYLSADKYALSYPGVVCLKIAPGAW